MLKINFDETKSAMEKIRKEKWEKQKIQNEIWEKERREKEEAGAAEILPGLRERIEKGVKAESEAGKGYYLLVIQDLVGMYLAANILEKEAKEAGFQVNRPDVGMFRGLYLEIKWGEYR